MQDSIPPRIFDWLKIEGSLTDHAKLFFQSVVVTVLRQEVEDEEVVREIVMKVDGINAWYARSIIPQSTYQLRSQQFKNLGSRPLADILYHDPEITRQQLRIEKIATDQFEYLRTQQLELLAHDCHQLWARRSIFKVINSPLYLVEILLPAFVNKILCINS